MYHSPFFILSSASDLQNGNNVHKMVNFYYFLPMRMCQNIMINQKGGVI